MLISWSLIWKKFGDLEPHMIKTADECKSLLDAGAVMSRLGWFGVLMHDPGHLVNKHRPTFFGFRFPYSHGSRLAPMITSQPGWPSRQRTAPVSHWPHAENTIIKSTSRIFFNALGGTLMAWLSRPGLLWTWCMTLRSKAERSSFSRTAAFMRTLHVFLYLSLRDVSDAALVK